jgi:two-component system response regulator CpxR
MPENTLLLIDDDVEFCDLLKEYLTGEGFHVSAVHDGETGYTTAINHRFDLIILDVMLPTLNGFEVLKLLKAKINTPVLMLTAKGEEVDQVIGLEIGADDYLPKPCSPRLLVARLKAILRRTNSADTTDTGLLQMGSLSINQATRTVTIAKKTLELTNSEYSILICLLTKAHTVVTKEELSDVGLNRKIAAFDRSVDMHISHLRSKLGASNECPVKIKTIRGIGYMLEK